MGFSSEPTPASSFWPQGVRWPRLWALDRITPPHRPQPAPPPPAPAPQQEGARAPPPSASGPRRSHLPKDQCDSVRIQSAARCGAQCGVRTNLFPKVEVGLLHVGEEVLEELGLHEIANARENGSDAWTLCLCAGGHDCFDMRHYHHHRLNRGRDRATHSRAVHAGRESISRRGEERKKSHRARERHRSD